MASPALREERVLVQTPWLRVWQRDFDVDDGRKTYTMVDRQDAVVVLPLTSAGNTLVVQQHRFPTGQLSWELPMGGIDDGEDPETAGRRELLEETGLVARWTRPLARWHPVPGLSGQRASLIVAAVTPDDLAAAAGRVTGADDIRSCRALPLAQLFDLAAAGDVTDGFTLAALLIATLNGLTTDRTACPEGS